jgi:molybdenum-dependent DNA-binding transcriptional regulator ModE
VTKSDPDSLRRRAIESRRRARAALSADLRHQLLEIAETYEDLADTVESIHHQPSVELTSQA